MGREIKVIKGKIDTVAVVLDGRQVMAVSTQCTNEIGDSLVYAVNKKDSIEQARALFDVWRFIYGEYVDTGYGLSGSAVLTSRYRDYTKDLMKSVDCR